MSGEIPKELLEEIFEIEYLGVTKEKVTYMIPTDTGLDIIYDNDKDNPLAIRGGTQVIAKSKGSGIVMAKLVLPYTDPNNENKFATISSDPPGMKTEYDSIIYKEFGKGKAIWISYPIEKIDCLPHKKTFINIIKKIHTSEYNFSSDVSPVVELVVFSQPEYNRYIINLINEQESLPPIPIYNFKIMLNIKSKGIAKIVSLTYKEKIKFSKKGEYVEMNVPKLELFNMILVEYK